MRRSWPIFGGSCSRRWSRESVQDVHNVRARKSDGGIIVNFHCRVSPSVTIAAAHDAVDRVERRLRALYPAITRAIGHVEPIKPGI